VCQSKPAEYILTSPGEAITQGLNGLQLIGLGETIVSKYLLVDIGAGTMDVLYFDDAGQQHYKAVVASPVLQVAKQIEAVPGNLLVTGVEMGGGPVTRILRERAKTSSVIISLSAAATLNHDTQRIQSWGIDVVADEDAEKRKKDAAYTHVPLADLDSRRLASIVEGLGVPFSFDVMGICAQDHGVPPRGVSHLDYRHNCFVERLNNKPFPHTLLYAKDEVPRPMNRLRSIAKQAASIPAGEVYVMDSGMAAILGASRDAAALNKQNLVVLDVATSHTVGAALSGGKIAGFFEYHTHDINVQRLEELIRDLADGNLNHHQVLSEGGHGCYMRKAVGYDNLDAIIATGPKRDIIDASEMPMLYGAPLGDNMMTGTLGLLEAIRKRRS
jgi:uncharacterized protein (DUF1786 family)